jgi:hypothetical protein
MDTVHRLNYDNSLGPLIPWSVTHDDDDAEGAVQRKVMTDLKKGRKQV